MSTLTNDDKALIDSEDLSYLDANFVNILNSISNERFRAFFSAMVDNYQPVCSQTDFLESSHLLNSEINAISSDIESQAFFRQIKYLINKSVYLRLSKKFLFDLINLGIDEDKVNTIKEIQKANLDKLIELLNISKNDSDKNSIKNINKIIDIELKTEMPVFSTVNKLEINETLKNEDAKKQNIIMTFKLDKKYPSENKHGNVNINSNNINNKNPGNNISNKHISNNSDFFQSLNIKMDKIQLAKFYSEIEKIQETLDKLS